MSKTPLLILAALFHGALGLLALIVPTTTANVFGMSPDEAVDPIIRLLGATLIGVALVFWVARNAADARLVRGVLVAGLVINALSFAIVAHAITGGLMGPRTWVTATIRLLFAIGFAYHALWLDRGRSVST
jgi:hypothetical protein